MLDSMETIVPDKRKMEAYLKLGLSQQGIADQYEEDTGIKVSRSAIAMAIERYGLQSAQPRARYMDMVPWRLAPEHRMHTDARMLRLEGRRRRGAPLKEGELRRLDQWLTLLRERDCVIHYDGRTARGFWWCPRTEEDSDIVRRAKV
jgi:hypothetical protein